MITIEHLDIDCNVLHTGTLSPEAVTEALGSLNLAELARSQFPQIERVALCRVKMDSYECVRTLTLPEKAKALAERFFKKHVPQMMRPSLRVVGGRQ